VIRVALQLQPPVLHSLVASLLSTDPGVLLVDGAEGPDVVVVSQADPENQDVSVDMLVRSPRSRVLALASDARNAVLYELRPHRTPLGELSRESLLAAVHAPAGLEEAR
jgi:hypothetical protein